VGFVAVWRCSYGWRCTGAVTKKRRGGESIELRWSPGREEEEDGNSTENGELQQEFSSIIMSSTSHGVYLEGSGGHGRTSLSSGGEPQVAPASLSDDKGDDEGAGVAGSTQMETDPPNVAPMDEALWGTLPEDLQDRILAWLPFPAFARACTVCKRWNSVMYSHSFLEMYRRVPSPDPCFLMFEAKDRSMCSVYNPASNLWHRIPFTFFHYETKFPCAAAGGLLCFCGVSAYPSLSVCNPLTRR